MKASFNSIGKAFKKMFANKTQKATSTPVVANAVNKQVQTEKRHKIPKMSESPEGRRWRNIAIANRAKRENKINRRRIRNKIAKKSKQVNYRIAA